MKYSPNSALNEMIAEMKAAPKEGRIEILSRLAFRFGQLAKAGSVEKSDYRPLIQAAISAGLPIEDVRQTFNSGFEAGREAPATSDAEIVNLVTASEIIPESIDWLWEGWLAAGKMHLIGGTPGTGKTTICLSLAAIISSGGKWPDGSQAEAGSVIIWSGEDDPKDTLVPRLMASGADCGRVHFVESVSSSKGKREFDPAKDIEPLHRRLLEVGDVHLLIVDPIVSAILGDSHKNAEVRRGLQPLVDLTELLRCALLGVTHFSKNTSGRNPVERLTGSLAFAAQARIVMVVSKKDKDDGSVEQILCRAKSNIGSDSGGFKYEVRQSALKEYPQIFASAIQWGEAIEGTAQEILTDAEDNEEEQSVLQDAKDYLNEILLSGDLPWSEISSGARPFQISDRTLKRAKTALGIGHKKKGDRWYWSLPEQLRQTDSTAPTKNLGALGPLEGSPVNDDCKANAPTVPTEPRKTLEHLKARRAVSIGKRLNEIFNRGIKEMVVH